MAGIDRHLLAANAGRDPAGGNPGAPGPGLEVVLEVVSYRDGEGDALALDEVSLTVAAGERVGCGRSHGIW